jgi:hypothetical protein
MRLRYAIINMDSGRYLSLSGKTWIIPKSTRGIKRFKTIEDANQYREDNNMIYESGVVDASKKDPSKQSMY